MSKRPTSTSWIATAIALSLTGGCDERVAEVAREAADRQAQQNTTMAELQQEVASGTRSLVQADAEARQKILAVHRDLQAERSRLDTGWNSLESQRQLVARQRRSVSALVAVTKLAGGLAVVIVLVGFCWYALAGLRSGDAASDAELNELLIREFTAQERPLLPADRRLSRPDRPGDLPAPAEEPSLDG
jgi:tetrahydromethanopterin S-methyltransferase subunit F